MGQDLNDLLVELADIEARVEHMSKAALHQEQPRNATFVDERLAEGEMLHRLRDYVSAAIVLSDIVNNHPNHPARADALFLLAESLFQAGDYLGARTRFTELLTLSAEPAFRPYMQRSLERLIEVAIEIGDFEDTERELKQLSTWSSADVRATTAYFRAKYLYNRAVPLDLGSDHRIPNKMLDSAALRAARRAFAAVPKGSPYRARAQYFVGVISTLRGDLEQAVQSFKRLLAAEAAHSEAQPIAELAHLALGRIYYELDRLDDARNAYGAIGPGSANFDTALYELAWVHLRRGDVQRADQSLELLGIATPSSHYIPDAHLLRGNLLMRAGRFDEAERLFEEVQGRLGPIRRSLEQLVSNRENLEAYFRRLVRENLTNFDESTFVSPEVQRWSETTPEMSVALRSLSDLSEINQRLRDIELITHRLVLALAEPNRVSFFSDLRIHRERTVALRNRLAQARSTILAAEDNVLRNVGSNALNRLRRRRRQLEQRVATMPVTIAAVQRRSARAQASFVRLAKWLKNLEVELKGMEARALAIEDFVSSSFKEPHQADGVALYLEELSTHKSAITGYLKQIGSLLAEVELGRLQVGVGDASFRRDDELRNEHREVVEAERRATSGMHGAWTGSADFDDLFERVARAEAQLDLQDERIETIARERAAKMRKTLDEEDGKLHSYQARIAGLSGESEVVVGAIAHQNFAKTNQRIYDLSQRADVGRIDVAWTRREEHRMRIEQLSKVRNATLAALDAEFSEIMEQEAKP